MKRQKRPAWQRSGDNAGNAGTLGKGVVGWDQVVGGVASGKSFYNLPEYFGPLLLLFSFYVLRDGRLYPFGRVVDNPPIEFQCVEDRLAACPPVVSVLQSRAENINYNPATKTQFAYVIFAANDFYISPPSFLLVMRCTPMPAYD